MLYEVITAGREGFLLGGASLALEETARNLARGVGALRVIHGQRKEILGRARFLRSYNFV